ncbi:MAG TPA: Ig-like domain-containing protein [Actinomycetota bacterium]
MRRTTICLAALAAMLAFSGSAYAAGPANDAAANAQSVRFNELYPGFTATGTNVGATKEAGEPDHAGNPGGHSVWFEFFPSYGGTRVTFETDGSSFDTLLAVYVRDWATGALTPVASNDDSGAPGGASRLSFLAAYQSYVIAVDGKDGATGSIALRWYLTRPPNDDFADARTIAGTTGSSAEQNVGATVEPGEPPHHPFTGAPGMRSIWFSWTAPDDGAVTFSVAESTGIGTQGSGLFIGDLTVYTGTTLATLTSVARSFNAVAGTTYKIAAWTPAGFSGGNIVLRWGYRPANDDFENASEVTGSPATLTGTAAGATMQSGEPSHDAFGSSGGASVWYRWTAPASGTVTIAKGGAVTPRNVVAYRGSSLSTLTVAGRTSFAANAGDTFMVAVDGTGPFEVTLTIGGPPNDNAASAQSIRFNELYPGFTTTGSTLGATKEAGEPDHAGNPGGHSIWFEFFPSYGGTDMTFETDGSSFDTLLAVYVRHWSTGALTLVASNDDSGAPGGASRLTFPAAYQSYVIVVDGKDGASGSVALRWYLTRPENDDFANAMPLGGDSGVVRQKNVGATTEPGEPPHHPYQQAPGQNTVWYSWTAPRSGRVTFDHSGSTSLGVQGSGSFIASTTVYTGSSFATLADIGTTFDAVAGTTYRIVVWGSAQFGRQGNIVLRWGYKPPNDDFADAQTVSGQAPSLTGNTVGATGEPGEPSHDSFGSSGSRSVWYRWTAPSGGTVTVTKGGEVAPSDVAFYTGATVGSLTAVGRQNFAVSPGTTYMVAVDARNVRGPFTVSWTVAGPSNDNRGAAQSIRFNELYPGFATTASNLGATKEPGEPNHAGEPGGSSVWFEYFPSYGGTDVTFTTAGSSFDTVIAVYTTDWWDPALRLVASNDDAAGGTGGSSSLSFTAEYRSYLVVVDGKAGAQGTIALRWHLTTPPNDAFADATPLSGESGVVRQKNVGATTEPGEPPHHPYVAQPGQNTVWFSWTAPRSGTVAFDHSGSSGLGTPGSGPFLPSTTVYTGSSLGGLTSLGTTRFEAVAGTTYRIVVWGSPQFGRQGNVVLRWGYRPVNDDFAAAQPVSGSSVTLTGSTLAGTSEAGEPQHATLGSSNAPSVWFRWTAPAAGVVVVGASAGEVNPSAVVFYTGGAVGALTRVGNTSFAVAGGQEYRIAVSASSQAGPFAVPFTFTPSNRAPVAQDVAVATDEDAPVAVALAATDEDGDALTYSVVSGPAHGSFDGARYTPNANFHGSDSFTYRASDGRATSNVASVTVTVAPVNDGPVASDGRLATDEDTSVAVGFAASDVDGDAITYTVTRGPAHGTFAAGTYTPSPNYFGTDTIEFEASDGALRSTGTVAIDVWPVNDPPSAPDVVRSTDEDVPLALALGGTDVDGDTLSVTWTAPAHGAYDGATYTPGANYHGADAFTYTVDDGNGGTATGSVSLTVRPVNDPPVVTLAAAATAIDEGGSTALTATASDVDGDALSYAWSAGTGSFSGAGAAVTYSNADGPRDDTAVVRVTDAAGATASAEVVVHVANVAPVASAGGPYAVTLPGAVRFQGSAVDPAGAADPLTYEWDVDYDGVTFAPNVTGASPQWSYVFPGTYAVALRVSDGDGGVSDLARAEVVVTAGAAGDATITGTLRLTGGATIHLAAHSKAGRSWGEVRFEAGGQVIELTEIGAIVVRGATATIFGTAAGVAVRVDLEDAGNPGAGDRARVRTAAGYDSGWRARVTGNLTVRGR